MKNSHIPLLMVLTLALGCVEWARIGDFPGDAKPGPDAAQVDPEAPIPDQRVPLVDLGPTDTGPEDAEVPDVSPEDVATADVPADQPEVAVLVDAGPLPDTAPEDVPVDAGVPDSGSVDAGPIDTGVVPDAGPADTGPMTVPEVSTVVDAGPPPVDTGVVVDTGPICPSGSSFCEPGCMDLTSDPLNCGACGRACSLSNAVPVCTRSLCAIGSCLPSYSNCDSDASNGCEINLQRDALNCGACGNACTAPTGGSASCVAGACVPACEPGFVVVGTECLPQPSCPSASTPGCGLVRILGGTLTLGDNESANASPPQDRVTVGTMLMDRSEVTVARFREFWNRGSRDGTTAPGTTSNCTWSATPGAQENYPINCVNQRTAAAFCRWEGGDLPTEAQWEYAARGPSGRVYPWGNTFSSTQGCWAQRGPCATGIYPMSTTPDGLTDMAGGVLEWTRDRYQPYTDPFCWGGGNHDGNSPCMNNSLGQWTIRGSSWGVTVPSYDTRAASRMGATMNGSGPGLGFRCVR